MTIMAILDSYQDIGRKASRFLLPASKVLIAQLQKKKEKAFKENQIKIPKDPSSVYKWLRLGPILITYFSCPDCWFLASQYEVEGNFNIKCHRYLEPHQIQAPCNEPLGKVIDLPHLPLKKHFSPHKLFYYQTFKSWLGHFLQRPKIHDLLSLHIEAQNNSQVTDIWQVEILKNFKGNQKSPFLTKPGHLSFLLYVDWFNSFVKSSRTSSTGGIMLGCLNLPPEVHMKPENIHIPAIIPGPKEPNGEQLNYLLRLLVEELKELWKGIHFFPTSNSSSGQTIQLAILTVIGDIVAIRKITGFISHSGSRFCSFCTIHKEHIEDIETDIWPSRRLRSHKIYVASLLNFSTATERASFFKEKGVRYEILEDLPYWDATEMNDSTDIDDIEVIISRNKWRGLKNDAQTPSNQLKAQESSISKIKSSDNIGFSSLTEPYHDDPDFISISSEKNVEGFDLSFHSYRVFNHQNIKALCQIVQQTTIPSLWKRVPKNVGSAKHGSLKAVEWKLLYNIYLPFLFLVSQLDGKEISLGIMNNTFLLISYLNIALSANVTQKKVGDWKILWSKSQKSCQKLFVNQRSKPNYHFSNHIPELMLQWGSCRGTATWALEKMNGHLSKLSSNKHIFNNVKKDMLEVKPGLSFAFTRLNRNYFPNK
ncbi:hypothetical protein O181_100754 [Austropuccinia psidii MF-1]|uniref:Transposase domain-containing protein n=1 Tax=Austropuccinia psidii MF-1 TaxID=1389203 RepID=A0A9Q3JFU4_9BASI|nr:hypothetical protein [Austropuccinia psidii MF-1]